MTLHSLNKTFPARLTSMSALGKGLWESHCYPCKLRQVSIRRPYPSLTLRISTKQLSNCNKGQAGHSFLCGHTDFHGFCHYKLLLVPRTHSLLLFQCWTLTSLLLYEMSYPKVLGKITGSKLIHLLALFWMLLSCLTKNFKYFVVGFSISWHHAMYIVSLDCMLKKWFLTHIP